jgi:putative membrane protein
LLYHLYNLYGLKMKRSSYLLFGVIVLFIISSCNENRRPQNYNLIPDAASISFIHSGLEAGQSEIKASEIAAVNSKNQHIIGFAKMVIADHSQAGDELQNIAINNKVTGDDSVSTDHQKVIANLKTLSGSAFDKAYIQMMVTDHQKAIELFTKAKTDKLETIQNFAQKVLPTLKVHLDSANAICAILK